MHRKTNAARFEKLLSPTLEPLKYQTKNICFSESSSPKKKMKTIYQCDQCDFQSDNRYHCIQHKEAIHELVKNLCDQYDFQNRIPKCLKNGIKRVKHDKIRHQCPSVTPPMFIVVLSVYI